MIEYSNSPLYNIKSKQKLAELLYFDLKEIPSLIRQYNIFVKGEKRLVESCEKELKTLHKRIFKFLRKLDLPNYLISAKKGLAYYNNYEPHVVNGNFCMLDIEKFYPKSKAYFVYKLFLEKFNMSPDVAHIMTEICTVNIGNFILNEKASNWYKNVEEKIKYKIPIRHIPTGSPISQILSFITFEDMFDDINKYCMDNGITLTIFVDDLTLSSKTKISKKNLYKIKEILNKHGHTINIDKTKFRQKRDNKRITGVVLNKKNSPLSQMKIHRSFHESLTNFKLNKSEKEKSKLLGYLGVINIIENNKYSNLSKKIKKDKLD